jgi:8-oxo-dGTP pyrophosphatase MutT (NUDIX family)
MTTHKNPWQKKSEKVIYSNPWIDVREDKVINPSGNESIYGVVSFRNRAAGIVALDEKNNIWLVGQYRYPLDIYSWELPMGGSPLDEDILSSAKRELKEETGLSAKNWEKICRIHTSNSVTNEEGFIYLATDLSEGETEFDETEKLEIRKLPLSDAIDMVMNNEITDAISIAGILKAARLKGV